MAKNLVNMVIRFPLEQASRQKRPNIFVLNVFIQKNIREIRSCYDNFAHMSTTTLSHP